MEREINLLDESRPTHPTMRTIVFLSNALKKTIFSVQSPNIYYCFEFCLLSDNEHPNKTNVDSESQTEMASTARLWSQCYICAFGVHRGRETTKPATDLPKRGISLRVALKNLKKIRFPRSGLPRVVFGTQKSVRQCCSTRPPVTPR